MFVPSFLLGPELAAERWVYKFKAPT